MKQQDNENKRPAVSIIMNCYNSDRFVREAIESVLAQTFSEWEIIFWDNQSTDQSAKIVQSFNDPRIKYYLAPFYTNLGPARENAVKKATGEWLAFLDADDLWLPEKLERQIQLIQEIDDPKLGLVYGRALAFGPDLPKEREIYPSFFYNKKLPNGDILKPLLFKGNFIVFSSALVLRKAYDAVGGILGNFEYAEDYYLLVVIATRYAAAAVQEYVIKYRLHRGNNTKKMGKNVIQEHVQILSMYIHEYPRLARKLKWFERSYYVKEYLKETLPQFYNFFLWLRWNLKAQIKL